MVSSQTNSEKIGDARNHNEMNIVPEIARQVDTEKPYTRALNEIHRRNFDFLAAIPR